MRKVSGPTPGATAEYVPEAFGNRRDESPIVVVFKVPTEEWKRAAARDATRGSVMIDRSTGEPERDASGRVRVAFEHGSADDRRRQKALECVLEVRNYDGADGKPIDSGARLWTHGESPIVVEVADHILESSGLTIEQRGNLGAQSDSSPLAMQPSSGTARDASSRASRSSGGARRGRK